jgi:MFS transporter, YQGE family, putative transporter
LASWEHYQVNRLVSEYRVFVSYPIEMRALIAANAIYALVLPVIEIFLAAYVMRNSRRMSEVMLYQLSIYCAIPVAFFLNGFILRIIPASHLYAAGMVWSGISLLVLMGSDVRTWRGVLLSGVLLGLSTGVFWANRGYLVLSSTTDAIRNYYYGVETSVITITSVVVPVAVGSLIASAGEHGSLAGINRGYRAVAVASLALTILASATMQLGTFRRPTKETFLFFRFHPIWGRMLVLAMLKGLVQGYIVTVPAMLVLKLVGQESTLGLIEAAGSCLVSLCLYVVGRACRPAHRVYIFTVGLLLLFAGSVWNGIFFNAASVLIFMACMLLAKPLLDFAYYPIQFFVTDSIACYEMRSEYSYILSHELGIFAGRFLGCSLFLSIALYISDVAALKYALPIVAAIQLCSVPVARRLLQETQKLRLGSVSLIGVDGKY